MKKPRIMSTSGLEPSIQTYSVVMTNVIKEGLLAEADDVFISMEKNGCSADSQLLNNVVRVLPKKGEIVRAGYYLSKIDKNNFFP
jgi:pentatricopeptide repeat protein